MRFPSQIWLLAVLALPACDSKITETVDQAKIDLITECLPEHAEKLGALLDYAQTWRLQGTPSATDPAGLSWSEQTDGTLSVTFVVGAFTITSTVSFYSPTGDLRNLDITATSLAEAIDDAAGQLRDEFQTSNPFMVGAWTITGTGVSGSGAFTGIIGGATNANELESISTTSPTPAGGPPPNADATITVTDSADTCTLTFNTTGLVTDGEVGQEYPVGTIDFTLSKEATDTEAAVSVSATMTFDGTATAKLGGLFTLDLDTFVVTQIN